MRSPNFRTAIVLLLFFCSLAQGVEWEKPVKLSELVDAYAYTSISKAYSTDTVMDKAFLVDQAKQAMTELRTRLRAQNLAKKLWPQAISALIAPPAKMIYFSSSIKVDTSVSRKSGIAVQVDKRLLEALKECQTGEMQRNNGEGCGKVMVMDLWFKNNTAHKNPKLPPKGKLIVTVNAEGKVIPPCEDSHASCDSELPHWDCKKFLAQIGFDPAQEVINSDPRIQSRSATAPKPRRKQGSKPGAACPLKPKQKPMKQPGVEKPVKKPEVKVDKPVTKPGVKVKKPVKKPVVKKPVKKPALPRRGASVR